tara:strand:- start:41 stop:175 length:135 start_codon:yes stop_codon:yes gene_type:complete
MVDRLEGLMEDQMEDQMAVPWEAPMVDLVVDRLEGLMEDQMAVR